MAFELDTDELMRMAATKAADTVIDEDDLFKQVRETVDARIDKLFSEKFDAVINDQIEAAMKDGFDREFHEIDSFGRPQGEPTTISKKLAAMVQNYWQETVDRNGKPTPKISYGDNTTRAEYTLLKLCGQDFHKELHQQTINAAGALKDGLRAELRGWVDKSLGEIFHVRSADDQAEKRNR